MSPKEKAKQLISKYRPYSNAALVGCGSITFCREKATRSAKQIAIISVDEIIGLEVFYSPHSTPEGLDFWNKVKEEIRKS